MSSSNRIPVSWKKTVFGLPIFILLLFIADRGLFRFFLTLEKNASRYDLENKLRAIPEKGKYEVLVFGTSRTFNAIQPAYVNPVVGTRLFKESYMGKGPRYNYYFYKIYKRIFGVPKVVVYGLDYFLFEHKFREDILQRFPEYKDLPGAYMNGPSLLLANKERIDQYIINCALNKIQKQTTAGRRLYNPEENFADMESYPGAVVKKESQVVTEIPPDFKKKKVPYEAFPGKEGVYFLRLLEELKKDNVTIFLITIPDHIGTYRTHRGNRRFVQDHGSLLKRLNYEGHAFLADYNSPKRFPMDDTECFFNGGYGQIISHLSIKGSKIFCEMFAKDLKSILEKTRRP